MVTVVNLGRRPIILRMWGGVDENGEWAGTLIESQKSGLRLGEHERHAITLEKDDLYFSTPDTDMILVNLWVEDSLGRRHTVKDAKENVKRLWNA